jgi:hypothetical protein
MAHTKVNFYYEDFHSLLPPTLLITDSTRQVFNPAQNVPAKETKKSANEEQIFMLGTSHLYVSIAFAVNIKQSSQWPLR